MGGCKFRLIRIYEDHETSWEGLPVKGTNGLFSHIELDSDENIVFVQEDHIEQVLNFIKLLEEK